MTDTHHSEAGKGSKTRPTDTQRYAANYDKIFGTKTHRLPLSGKPALIEQKTPKTGEI